MSRVYYQLHRLLYHLIDSGQSLNKRQSLLVMLLIAAMMAAVTALIYATGVTHFTLAYLMYFPVLSAALVFYAPGGLLAGILASLLLGLMFHQVPSTEVLQQGWLYWLSFLCITGVMVGFLSGVLHWRLTAITRLNDAMSTTYAHTLQTFAGMVAVRDEQTGGHCERVAHNASALGKALGLKQVDLEALYWAGLLHDAGKVAIPDRILLKPSKLNAEEYALVKQHTIIGAEMLNRISADFAVITAGVRSHHECWDGRGYPDGLAGEAIPLFGRILAIVDVFEALTSYRSYREPLSTEQALKYLREGAGSHFDPKLVPIFERLYHRGKIFVHEDLEFDIEFRAPAQFRTRHDLQLN